MYRVLSARWHWEEVEVDARRQSSLLAIHAAVARQMSGSSDGMLRVAALGCNRSMQNERRRVAASLRGDR